MTGDISDADAPDVLSDPELIAQVRAGDLEAFSELYSRHVDGVRRLALKHADNPSDADDLVADAFAAVFERLRDGGGPDTFFRGYVFTTVARMAYRYNRRSRAATPTEDIGSLEEQSDYADPVLSGFEATAVASAFAQLPERWQSVLWYSEVDGMRPAAISPLLGISANGVSALSARARDGLREAYLAEHLEIVDEGCRPFAPDLAGYAVGALSKGKVRRLEQHLTTCRSCPQALDHLRDVGGSMRGVIFPLIAGIGFLGYLGAQAIGSGADHASTAERRPNGRRGTKIAVAAVAAVAVAALSLITILAGGNSAGPGPLPGPGSVGPATPAQSSNAGETTTRPTPTVSTSAPAATPTPTAVGPRPSARTAPPDPTAPASNPPRPTGSASPQTSTAFPPPITPAPEKPRSPSAAPTLNTVASGVSATPAARDKGVSEVAVTLFVLGRQPVSSMSIHFSAGTAAELTAARLPVGWSCLPASAGLTCTTPRADPTRLRFTIGVPTAAGSIGYQVTGDNLVPHDAAYQL